MFVREKDFGSRPLAPIIVLGLGAVALVGGGVFALHKGYKLVTKVTKEVHPPKQVKQDEGVILTAEQMSLRDRTMFS